jgi:broad specificity phosphatase PhoE
MGPSMRKTPLAFFVRHGETANNANGKFRGAGNIPLDAKGKQQAKFLGDYFKNIPISKVFSSPKDRAKDTAEAIARPKSLNVEVMNGLQALDVGYLSGEKKSDHEYVMDYFQKFEHEHIPMGDSIKSFRERSQPDIQKIIDLGMNSDVPPLAAVHSSIIHEVNHMLTGDHKQTLVEPGGVIAVYHHPELGFKIKAVLHPSSKASNTEYTG